jgi:hypothetical protein
VDGLRETVTHFSQDVHGAGPQDVMDLLLLTQYFEMIKTVGHKQKNAISTIFLPHGPQAVSKLRIELEENFMKNMSQNVKQAKIKNNSSK